MKHSYFKTYKNIELKPLSQNEIELLRSWRNDPANTKYLSKIPFITEQMQREWFERYLLNVDEMTFAIYEVKELERAVGSLSLYDFSDESAELGKIMVGDSAAHGKKIGYNAVIAALKIAFDDLKLKKVRLTVFEENAKALYIYQKAGFKTKRSYDKDGRIELYMEIEAEEFFINTISLDDVYELSFSQCGDARGKMVVVEGGRSVPFEIKRAFYSYATDTDAIRGQHANRKSAFVMICVAGSCKVRIVDLDGKEGTYELSSPEKGLYIPKMLWKDMFDFSNDCVLLILSDEHYDKNEYIRDYSEYLNLKTEVK